MPIDIVKPLKIERVSSGGSQNDEYPTEMNANEDYLGAKGIAFKGQDTTTIDVDSNNEIIFKDVINGTKKLSDLTGSTGGGNVSAPVDLVSGRVPFISDTNELSDSENLTWNNTTNTLGVLNLKIDSKDTIPIQDEANDKAFVFYNYTNKEYSTSEYFKADDYTVNNNTPIRHYKLNETSGTTVYDSGSDGENGTIVGTININQTGKIDKCYDFGSTTDSYITTAHIDITDTMTFCGWTQAGTLAGADSPIFPIFHQAFSNGQCGISIGQGGSDAETHLKSLIVTPGYDYSYIFPIISSFYQQWFHFAVVINNGTIKIYFNGSLDSTDTSSTGSFSQTNNPMLIGSDLTNDYFDKVDDLRIYDCALSEQEILSIYNNGSGTETTSMPTEIKIPNAEVLKVKYIKEKNSNQGVDIDGILLKDNTIQLDVGTTIQEIDNELSFTDPINGTHKVSDLRKLNGYSLNTNDAADNVILEFDTKNLELQASNYRVGNLGSGNTQGQQTSLGEKSFVGVDLSDNGQYMLAGDNAGYLWISSDMGATWTQKSISQNWSGVYVSSTGQYMAAVAGAWVGQAFVGTTSCYIYYSTDYGNNWSISNKTGVMNRICGSADGSKLYVTEGNGAGGGSSRSGYVYKSTNYGATWTQSTLTSAKWNAICCSVDGSKIFIGDYSTAGAYISTDSGANWGSISGISGSFSGAACSSDFSILYVGAVTDVYKSTDSGSSWETIFTFTSDYVKDISCSSDGKTVFLATNQKLYKSIDSGVTFFEITDFGTKSWLFISTTPNTSIGIISSYYSYVYIYSPFKYIPISNNTVNTFLNADKVDGADLSTDATLFSNSDILIPSQKAIKSYVDSRGNPTLNLVYLADRRSAQNLTQNTWTKILWATTQHSNSTYVTYNSSTGEFTAVTGGKYRVYARIAVVNGLTAGTSLVRIEVNKNVSPTGFHEGGYKDKVATNNAGTVYVIIDVTYTVTVNTNDKFCVWVHCDASGSKIWEYYWMNQVIVEKVA